MRQKGIPLDHIAVQIYGPHRQLLGHCRIPAAALPQFTELVEIAREGNPAYTEASLFRWMLKVGHKGLTNTIRQLIATGLLPVPTGE